MNVAHPLGNVAEQRLSEIWSGEPVRELRRAIEASDLSSGCEFCAWPVSEGRQDLAFARNFDTLRYRDADPLWPTQLEMSVSNVCNLQCVMCNGEWSSSIRSQREGRAPLPAVYGEEFFEDLALFLPHLEKVKFLGGEPFLAAETLRVMEMLVDAGLSPSCHVTTNGTQWTPRVERIMTMLPVDVSVSLDATTAKTYESIRVGSSWDKVMANLDRFEEMAQRRRTGLSLTFCLMTVNWHEFGDFCQLTDSRGFGSWANTVTDPDTFSLYRLPSAELRHIVEELEAQDLEIRSELGRSRRTWVHELDRLRKYLEQREQSVKVAGLDYRGTYVDPAGPESPPDTWEDLLVDRDELDRYVDFDDIWVDFDDTAMITSAAPGIGRVLDRPDSLAGTALEDLGERFAAGFGQPLESATTVEGQGFEIHEARFGSGRVLRFVVVPRFHGQDCATGRMFVLDGDN